MKHLEPTHHYQKEFSLLPNNRKSFIHAARTGSSSWTQLRKQVISLYKSEIRGPTVLLEVAVIVINQQRVYIVMAKNDQLQKGRRPGDPNFHRCS